MVHVLKQNDSEGLDLSYRAEFMDLIRRGAGSQDICDPKVSSAFAGIGNGNVSAEFIDRELHRSKAHQRSLVSPLLEPLGQRKYVLDVGCSTGAITVALARSSGLDAKEVFGIDPTQHPLTLLAAEVRAKMYRVADKTKFQPDSGISIPHENESFDLVTCVSVLEFVPTTEDRQQMILEMQRVTTSGGYIYLSTPSPWRLQEFHSRRFLGHFRQADGFPWSTRPGTIQKLFAGWKRLDVFQNRMSFLPEGLKRLGAPWQKFLYQKP